MAGFTSGLARGLSTGLGMAKGRGVPQRPGADSSEVQRQSRIGGLMDKIGQGNTLTSTADRGDAAAAQLRARLAAGGNETKVAPAFASGGVVGRNYAKC